MKIIDRTTPFFKMDGKAATISASAGILERSICTLDIPSSDRALVTAVVFPIPDGPSTTKGFPAVRRAT